MNLAKVDQIAKAVLYEGYMLYPYRPSSVKNRQRWNFGVVYPQEYGDAQGGEEPYSIQTECLVCGNSGMVLEVKVRFLHLQARSSRELKAANLSLPDGWQEVVERDVDLPRRSPETLSCEPLRRTFAIPAENQIDRRQEAIHGTVDLTAERVGPDLFKISVVVCNHTPLGTRESSRDEALMHSLVSTHLVLGIEGGEFVSLLEPPPDLQELAAQCRNVGVWPVLVGEPGQRDTLLASPIILYDYPQIAPESAGDLFDGTEIDEILSLRIMTLTDDEKREIRQSDERARQILERTESMPAEQFMKLHGAVRGLRPLREDTQ